MYNIEGTIAKTHRLEFVMRKKVKLYVLFLLLLTFIFPSFTVRAKEKEDIVNTEGELHGFYPSYLTFSDGLKKYIDDLDSISFAFGQIEEDDSGSLNTVKGKKGNYSFYYPSDYIKPIEYAKSKGKSIQLSIYMNGASGVKFLPYEDERAAIIETIIEYMETDISLGKNPDGLYYDGVVIDFEGLRDTDSKKEPIFYEEEPISVYYTLFLEELKAELDYLDKKLYTAVNPALYFDGYNFSDILTIADRMILMAHDYEPVEKLKKSQAKQYTDYNTLKPIHSLSPMQMLRRALNEIKEAVEDTELLSKVWLQINLDAAQWQFEVKNEKGWEELSDNALSKSGRISPLYKTIKTRLDNADGYGKNITYGYNNELQSPYIQYYNSSDKTWNIIIYENSTNITAKIDLAKEYGLGGISLWSLYNIPDYNDKTSKKFGLNGWSAILSAMDSYDTVSEDSENYVTLKDPIVEEAIREKLGIWEEDISVAQLKKIYRLKLPAGVTSLKDLKKLTNLEYLDLSGLNLTNLNDIGNLKKLKVLYLARNEISNLDFLKKLTKLEVLSLNGNKLTSVTGLDHLIELRELYVSENNIKSITSLSTLTKLEKLALKDNKITSISSLKKLKNLKELYLSGNKITNYTPVKTISEKKGFISDFKHVYE